MSMTLIGPTLLADMLAAGTFGALVYAAGQAQLLVMGRVHALVRRIL